MSVATMQSKQNIGDIIDKKEKESAVASVIIYLDTTDTPPEAPALTEGMSSEGMQKSKNARRTPHIPSI